jgi:hypothetical protein
MKARWLLLLCAGCAIADRTYRGPTIQHVELTNNDAERVRATDAMPSFTLRAEDTQYAIAVEIASSAGDHDVNTNSDSSSVTGVTTTFSIGGTMLPSPSYMASGREEYPLFTSTAPLVVPASAKGGVLAVHAVAVDSDGLESNVVDFSIALK